MQKYQYEFVKIYESGLGGIKGHREIIEDYSKRGYRFVAIVPAKIGAYDIVFEKERA